MNTKKGLPDFLDSKSPPKSRLELINRLKELRDYGWIQTRQQFNDGLVSNTLEDFLEIEENNLT